MKNGVSMTNKPRICHEGQTHCCQKYASQPLEEVANTGNIHINSRGGRIANWFDLAQQVLLVKNLVLLSRTFFVLKQPSPNQ